MLFPSQLFWRVVASPNLYIVTSSMTTYLIIGISFLFVNSLLSILYCLHEEAQISIWIGKAFGAVIPDIEDEYMGQYASAESFGQQVRASFTGLWMPTLYANPLNHPVPLLSLNPYMDAWLP